MKKTWLIKTILFISKNVFFKSLLCLKKKQKNNKSNFKFKNKNLYHKTNLKLFFLLYNNNMLIQKID